MLKKKRTLLCQNVKRIMNSRVSILTALLSLLPLLSFGQQTAATPAARIAAVTPAPRSEWLGSFNGISVNGVMHVHLVKQSSAEGPRIVYDTRGEEPADPKRTTVTEVTVYCNDISSLNVAAADLSFDTPVQGKMFDLYVSGGASVRGCFEVADLAVEATGRSSVVIEGSARYMTLNISTAKFDGSALHTVSSIIDASHGAEVRIAVAERIEASTSTSAQISYTGRPDIVRCRTTMFGGEITAAGE